MTETHTHFDFQALSERERYKLLIGTVIPRPIALVTTVSQDGHANAGPFSFFNVLTHDPALLAIGIEHHPDGRPKDTARNIAETGEFTVHIADMPLMRQMEICAIKFGPEVDELQEAGLTTVPGRMVKSPRIVAAPAALECRLHTVLKVSPARDIVIGEVVGAFIRSDAVDEKTFYVDQGLMDAVGRLGGALYTRTQDQFEIKTQTVDEYRRLKASAQEKAREDNTP